MKHATVTYYVERNRSPNIRGGFVALNEAGAGWLFAGDGSVHLVRVVDGRTEFQAQLQGPGPTWTMDSMRIYMSTRNATITEKRP